MPATRADFARANATSQLGLALVAITAGLWLMRGASGPPEVREGTFSGVFAVILLPTALMLLIAGAAERTRFPGWRAMRWLPLAGLFASYLTCARIF
jgi:hypothetical protein